MELMNLMDSLNYFERIVKEETNLTDVDIMSKDTGGNHGTDFEEKNRKISYNGKKWVLEYSHTKSVQPNFAPMITKTIDSWKSELNQEDLILFLESDLITVKELELFYKNIQNP